MTRALVADIVDTSCVDGPGNRYVVFLQGCTFNCLACHNPHTIDRRPSASTKWMDVADLHADIASTAAFLSGITVSGGEPTLQWAAVHELFDRLAADPKTARLTRLVDSNGDADAQVWDVLATSMHGAMIDLKALDPDIHQLLTGRSNSRVLAAIRQLAALDRLTELRLLIVPGVNDASEQLAATARWLGGLDPTPQIVVQGFRHEGTRSVARRFREAAPADLENVVVALVGHGIPADHVRARGVPGLRSSLGGSSWWMGRAPLGPDGIERDDPTSTDRGGLTMPPHCDSLDGPVVTAAREALDTTDVDLILPFVRADGAAEIQDAFDRAVKARALGPEAQDVADRWFFETAVRVHRAGEGAPYTGLKPAGLDVGPVIPAAERALATGSTTELTELLCSKVRDQVERRHARAMALKVHAGEGVEHAREYVEAMLGLQVWAHTVHKQLMAEPHPHVGGHART